MFYPWFRGLLATALLAATAAGCAKCSCGSSGDEGAAGPEKAPADAALSAAEIEERAVAARRDELLRRGNPALMKPAPVINDNEELPDPTADIKHVSKDVLEVGNLRVDLAEHRVTVPAKVAQTDAVLEFLVTEPKGKAYESVLVADTTAVHLRLALTLIGVTETEITGDKLPEPAPGSRVRIFIDTGKGKPMPATRAMYDRAAKRTLAGHPWMMTSPPDSSRQMALRTRQFVSTIFDPLAVINPVQLTGNPYAGPGVGLVAHAKALPARDTEVTLVFEAADPGAGKPNVKTAPPASQQGTTP